MAKQYVMMEKTACFMAAVLVCVVSACSGGSARDTDERIDTLLQILQLKECSRLYTSEYEIHKLVLKDDPLRVKGSVLNHPFDLKVPMGERKVMIPIDVTLKAYIDFSEFGAGNVKRDGERITVYLPDPRVAVTSSRIDHDEVRQFISLTRSRYSSAEMADFARQGEEEIVKTLPELGILETARKNAAHVVVPLLTKLGFEERNIVVTFRKELTGNDIPLLWDREKQTEVR